MAFSDERFEFEAGFVSADEKHPEGVASAAVARVAADIAKALAAKPSDWRWENDRKVSLVVSVQGPDVDGVALDSCLRVVAKALRITGMLEGEHLVAQADLTKSSGGHPKPRMLVVVLPL